MSAQLLAASLAAAAQRSDPRAGHRSDGRDAGPDRAGRGLHRRRHRGGPAEVPALCRPAEPGRDRGRRRRRLDDLGRHERSLRGDLRGRDRRRRRDLRDVGRASCAGAGLGAADGRSGVRARRSLCCAGVRASRFGAGSDADPGRAADADRGVPVGAVRHRRHVGLPCVIGPADPVRVARSALAAAVPAVWSGPAASADLPGSCGQVLPARRVHLGDPAVRHHVDLRLRRFDQVLRDRGQGQRGWQQ